MNNARFQVAVIGAGPVGLAAAANLLESSIDFVVLERSSGIAASVREWGHVKLFSPWKYNIDPCSQRLLEKHQIALPAEDDLPTGHQLIDQYLANVAGLPGIAENIWLNTSVVAVGRDGLGKVRTRGRETHPFEIQVEQSGVSSTVLADFVIDASGTWANPNPMGGNGYAAPGELLARERITYRIPDILGDERQRYEGQRVAVIGSGHSAINSILDLCRLRQSGSGTDIHWLLRKSSLNSLYGGKQDDQLVARGQLGMELEKRIGSGEVAAHYPVSIQQVLDGPEGLTIEGTRDGQPFVLEGLDQVIVNTGARPDFSFLHELRYDRDSALECVPAIAEMIDPNLHSCGTVRPHGEYHLRQPERNFYIVGSKSYGRAPTFLMATGYEQVRSIVAHIRGDAKAAAKVHLVLPETGVCSSSHDVDGSCC